MIQDSYIGFSFKNFIMEFDSLTTSSLVSKQFPIFIRNLTWSSQNVLGIGAAVSAWVKYHLSL